ncbi:MULTISPECIES: encapsulin [Leptospira]|uniref:encapsulin n=1 Tax=Leptospira TaxID=171 RepID=UPI001F0EBC8F|nr:MULTISPECIES: encapsulin [Leptospira]UML80372.1 encapsulin [Leptospira kirschneri]UMQ54066.1 encapsulin [Leptospira interrogans]
MPILHKNDLLFIESVLLTPEKEELQFRRILRVNQSYAPYAREIGYDVLKTRGRASIVAAGAKNQKSEITGESIERITQPAIDIESTVTYSEDELEAMMAKRNLGKGPFFALDQVRIETARNEIAEAEDYVGFNGVPELKVEGLLTKEGIKKETVPSFDTLTASQILSELHNGIAKVGKGNRWNPRTLVLCPEDYYRLIKPLNDFVMVTLLEWFKQNGLYFNNIVKTNSLSAENNVLGKNLFLVMDSSPKVAEAAVLKDITLGRPVTDYRGDTDMLVRERFGGALVRFPEAIFLGVQDDGHSAVSEESHDPMPKAVVSAIEKEIAKAHKETKAKKESAISVSSEKDNPKSFEDAAKAKDSEESHDPMSKAVISAIEKEIAEAHKEIAKAKKESAISVSSEKNNPKSFDDAAKAKNSKEVPNSGAVPR